MDFVQYKCPCCGSALTFSPKTQKLSCKSCNNEYEISVMQQYEADNQAASDQDLSFHSSTSQPVAQRTDDGHYICPSCGAEIEAADDKVSTICPYCDNVVILTADTDEQWRPDAIIPFKVTGDQAKQMLADFCHGKRLLPKNFRNRSYLKNLKGYYVPYWLFTCDAEADMSFHATRTRAWSDSDYDYIDTSYYLVNRTGSMSFCNVPVDGSTHMEDETTESIEPFHYEDLTEFKPAYLAGYESDKYDVDAKTAEKRANERLYNSAEDLLCNTVQGYDTVHVKRRQMTSKTGQVQYVLLPVWLFETVYQGKNYQFAINGQTGKMVGELPMDTHAFWKYLFGFTGAFTILLSILGIFLLGGVW